jgi:hypothetical protein
MVPALERQKATAAAVTTIHHQGMRTMELAITGHEAVDHDDLLVHTWRVARLTRLGIPELLAEIHADHLDWHQIARLAQRGCPPRLAFRIVS